VSFTVETGAGIAGANSYQSVADCTAYWLDRAGDAAGLATAWAAALTASQQAALIRASAYLDATYEWATGIKYTETQGLAWPRSGAVDRHGYDIDSDELPQAVKDATCELAARALSETLGGGDQGREMTQATAGSVSVTYLPGQAKRYTLIDNILTGLVLGSGSVRLRLS
jgi:hypothetical protein